MVVAAVGQEAAADLIPDSSGGELGTLDGMTTGEIRSLTSVMADNGCISWRRYFGWHDYG
jgi:hypothetical protein